MLDSPIFGEFGLHAAAEGLFHPASTIAAFIEHDAKYNDKMRGKSSSKPSSGRSSLSSRSGSRSSTVGEYLPSLETQKLPVLLNDKGKRVKLESTPSATSSTASLLLDPASASSRSASSRSLALASTRSDSDLHAPRKLGAVPSSADRNALDFFDHDDDDEDTDDHSDAPVGPARVKSSPSALGTFALSSTLGSSKSAATLSSVSVAQQPQDDADRSLTQKFEDLKLLMAAKQKTKKASTARPTSSAKQPVSKSRSQHVTGADKAEGRASNSSSRIAKAPSDSSATGALDGRRRTGAGATIGVPVIVKTPPVKSRKDMKIRNGISLADLKEEHRAALELLRELGGPMDTDVDLDILDDERSGIRSKPTRSTRSTKASAQPRASHKLTTSAAARAEPQNKTATASSPSTLSPSSSLSELEPQTPSPVSSSSGSLVMKLRAAVPSARAKTPDEMDPHASVTSLLSERVANGSDEKVDVSTMSVAAPSPISLPNSAPATGLSSADRLDIAAPPLAATTFALSRSDRSLENVQEVDEDDEDTELEGANHDLEQSVQDVGVEENDLWKQYDGDDDDDNDDDNLDDDPDEDDGATDANNNVRDDASHSVPVTARSVDLYGDDGFETEW